MFNPARRRVLMTAGAALALGCPTAAFAYPAPRAFAAIRNGKRIGEHRVSFEGAEDDFIARIRAEMAVKLGPVTVFRYVHEVREHWRGGRFERLESRTSSNGARESVIAQRTPAGVILEVAGKRTTAAGSTLPFTHWNRQVVTAPLFNPQTGKLLRLTARDAGQAPPPGGGAPARRVSFRGDAEIDNWYDADGAWVGLRGRLDDGSTMEYRRI